ncbi:MAG: DUF302 domain-containing protein [Ferruginibacter sp.]
MLPVLAFNKQDRRYFIKSGLAVGLYSFLPFKNLKIMNPKGVSIRQSAYSVKESIDRLQAFLQKHGATVYSRIDQQNEALNAGLNLSPLEFILFGNPIAGVPIMVENPLAALDLPLKIIAWEDNQKKVWLAFNDAVYIEDRYSLNHSPNSPLALDQLIEKALEK